MVTNTHPTDGGMLNYLSQPVLCNEDFTNLAYAYEDEHPQILSC